MPKFASFLAPLMRDYMMYQKASGRWNDSSYEPNLLLFDRYCQTHAPAATHLTQDLIDSWCRQRDTEINNSCRSRIYVVASFVGYLRTRGNTQVMPPPMPRREPRAYIPHAFTETELRNFFHACDSISAHPHTVEQRDRKVTLPVFFRLLYSSGLRTNEARLLRVEDVDWHHGILNIRYSKGHAQHYVVLHDSMRDLLTRYDAVIRRWYPQRTYLFPARHNASHTRKWVQTNFRSLWDQANPSYATAYALRHHYAVVNINRWTDAGFGFHAQLLYLSKSMGHHTVESTKSYYALVPGLADILEDKTGADFDQIVPEVAYEESPQ
ncbi:MAG: tyrosine-type recombinase/integrase [Candidatus Limnocylindrales bacterium]